MNKIQMSSEVIDAAVEGCPGCGMTYSFFFNTQFHKSDCTHITSADLEALKVSDKPIKIIKTL